MCERKVPQRHLSEHSRTEGGARKKERQVSAFLCNVINFACQQSAHDTLYISISWAHHSFTKQGITFHGKFIFLIIGQDPPLCAVTRSSTHNNWLSLFVYDYHNWEAFTSQHSTDTSLCDFRESTFHPLLGSFVFNFLTFLLSSTSNNGPSYSLVLPHLHSPSF